MWVHVDVAVGPHSTLSIRIFYVSDDASLDVCPSLASNMIVTLPNSLPRSILFTAMSNLLALSFHLTQSWGELLVLLPE
jgi:hypothetical protein